MSMRGLEEVRWWRSGHVGPLNIDLALIQERRIAGESLSHSQRADSLAVRASLTTVIGSDIHSLTQNGHECLGGLTAQGNSANCGSTFDIPSLVSLARPLLAA